MKRFVVVVLALLPLLSIAEQRPVSGQETREMQPATTRPPRPARAFAELPADRLLPVHGCAQVRDHLGDVLVEMLVDQRYGNFWRWWEPTEGPSGFDTTEPPREFTTTNNQEEGIDELDLVKTDGLALYLAQEQRLDIVRSWPPHESELLSSYTLPGPADGLFLDDDRLLVFSHLWQEIEPGRVAQTRIELLDVSDRTRPGLVRRLDLEGRLLGARKIGRQVYVVVSASLRVPDEIWPLVWRDDLGLPTIDWDAPDEEREAAAELARSILRPLVDASLASVPTSSLLPLLRTGAGDVARITRLLECRDLHRPPEPSTQNLLAVLSIDLDTFAVLGRTPAVGVLADGFTIYSSGRSLYIAQPSFWWWWGWGDLDLETAIHRFELDPEHPHRPVSYRASGKVPGVLLDQFSMGEHEGYLRVATTEFDRWWGTVAEDPGSRVTVLQDDGSGRLREVGHVAGIAPGEQIFASRFLGEKGFLVTFEQIDPLFTLDLSDPAAPRIVGELEMPGFSTYLHPVGDNHLLAVGRAGREDGTIEGLAINLFDVSDFAHPVLAFQHLIDAGGGWSWSEALHDHHAFTYSRNVLSIPAYSADEDGRFHGVLVFWVHPQGGILELGRIDHAGFGQYPQVRRSVYIEEAIYSISNRGVKVNDLIRPSYLYAEVPLR